MWPDHGKLPNLVTVAVLGFAYFWRKIKAFFPLEARRCDEVKCEWIIKSKTFFHAKSFPTPPSPRPFFFGGGGGGETRGGSFGGGGGGKKLPPFQKNFFFLGGGGGANTRVEVFEGAVV